MDRNEAIKHLRWRLQFLSHRQHRDREAIRVLLAEVDSTDDGRSPIVVGADEVPAVFAALCTMVLDNHSPQDCLESEDWDRAEKLFKRFEDEMNRRLVMHECKTNQEGS